MKRDSTLVLLVLNEIDGLRLVWNDHRWMSLQGLCRRWWINRWQSRVFTEKNFILDQPIPGRGVAFVSGCRSSRYRTFSILFTRW